MKLARALPATDPHTAAHTAGLRYVSDISPGIRRTRRGKQWQYRTHTGALVRDARSLARIRSLAIPPAWQDVWICPHPTGHIQATGRDAKGRKQYRYHPLWKAIRDRTKYDKLRAFGMQLPAIRARVARDLEQPGLPRTKVLAAIVRILDMTHMRIGNEEYAKDNKSYGITTLHQKHVALDGSTVRFRFRGKSGQQQDVQFHDPRIARIIRRCEELPGHELFAYQADDGRIVDIGSHDVNGYVHAITGDHFTAKDFRTWGGTMHAALCLYQRGECDTVLKAKKCMTRAVQDVAGFLGNKPATCKKYYIDPRIFSAYQRNALCTFLAQKLTKNKKYSDKTLQPLEEAVLELLEKTVD